MSEQSKIDAERAAFEAFVVREWPTAPLHYVRDALPKTDPRYGEYCDESLQRAWVGWQARASQPVGVPDDWRRAVYQAEECLTGCLAAPEVARALDADTVRKIVANLQAARFAMLAAPTVKAEQVQALTGERLYGMWVAASGLGADPWDVVTHEHDGWNGLAAQLTDAAPSLPAAGSAGEEVGSHNISHALRERLLGQLAGDHEPEEMLCVEDFYSWLSKAIDNIRAEYRKAEGSKPVQVYASAALSAQQSEPTPEFVWVRLLEALAGDNGCSFSASTDDYREAKPALTALIAAGFFRDGADSLDGDIWMVAAGEEGEAKARFDACAHPYANLSAVLNRVFERPAGGE